MLENREDLKNQIEILKEILNVANFYKALGWDSFLLFLFFSKRVNFTMRFSSLIYSFEDRDQHPL